MNINSYRLCWKNHHKAHYFSSIWLWVTLGKVIVKSLCYFRLFLPSLPCVYICVHILSSIMTLCRFIWRIVNVIWLHHSTLNLPRCCMYVTCASCSVYQFCLHWHFVKVMAWEMAFESRHFFPQEAVGGSGKDETNAWFSPVSTSAFAFSSILWIAWHKGQSDCKIFKLFPIPNILVSGT